MRIWLNNASMRLTIVRVQRLALTMRIDTSLYDLCFQWLHIDNTHIIYPTKLKALFPKIIKKKARLKSTILIRLTVSRHTSLNCS